jgi:ABC-type oligopeptide transport system ATPase subunit/biotin operon repressor
VLARLTDATSGRILLDGEDIGAVPAARFARHRRRGDVQMVFQDPTDSLNPRMTAAGTIAEPLRLLERVSEPAQLQRRVLELAESVGLPPELLSRFPRQLSGGQKARVGIARALASSPRLLILDEPTSALDVSVQALVLQLLARLRAERGLAYLFVSHDLEVVRLLCDRVVVMYLGRVIETGPAPALLSTPAHPYTQALVSAIPGHGPRVQLTGEVRSPVDPRPTSAAFTAAALAANAAAPKRCPHSSGKGIGRSPAICRRRMDEMRVDGGGAAAARARPVRRPSSENLAARVFATIKQDIFDFRLLPGDRFTEGEVADRMGVSRTPVREALYQLEREGYVDVLFRPAGRFVPSTSRASRTCMTCGSCSRPQQCAGCANSRRRPRASCRCEPALADPRVGAPARPEGGGRARRGLHAGMVAAAGNDRMARIHGDVTAERIRIIRRLDFTKAPRIDATYVEHRNDPARPAAPACRAGADDAQGAYRGEQGRGAQDRHAPHASRRPSTRRRGLRRRQPDSRTEARVRNASPPTCPVARPDRWMAHLLHNTLYAISPPQDRAQTCSLP